MPKKGKYGKIIFFESDIQFIKENFQSMTNQEIADALELKKTTVRTKAYALGLQRMTLEYWTDEAVNYLKAHYHKIGDKELAEIFTKKFPKEKGWSKSHFQKKLSQLGLSRNKMDWYTIKERNRRNGSFGKMNKKNNPPPPKVLFNLNSKTRIQLKPGQTIEGLKEKYQHIQ